MKSIKGVIEHLKRKMDWVNKNTDINYQGELEEHREGICEGLRYVIEVLEEDM